MLIINKYDVNLQHPEFRKVLYAVQNESNTRAVELSLFLEKKEWKIPDGTLAVVKYRKRDGTSGLYDTLPDGTTKAVTFNGNKLTAVLAPQVLTYPGGVDLVISLLDNNHNQLSVFPLLVCVSEDPSAGTVTSEDYINLQHIFLPQTKDAKVGQYLQISKVDTDGRVIAVKAVDAPSGGGGSGEDGYSPVATVTQTANGATVTITDKNGTTTANVANGKDGKDGYTPVKGVDYFDGQPGNDGTSPVVAVTAIDGGHRITITDANGTKTVDVMDGKDGLDATPVTPLFANSLDECTDTTKLYVLPDGYIYAYLYKEASGPAYTNLAGAVQENTRQNSSGVAKALDGAITTDFIPVKQGDMVRVKGFDPTTLVGGNYPYVAFFTGASESAIVATDKVARGDGVWTVNGDVYEYTPFMLQTEAQHSLASSITHIRINGAMTGAAADVIVTVNEEIVEGAAGGYSWQNTGHAFVPTDYESRIISLESHARAIPASRIKAIEDTLDDVQTAKPWKGKKWVAIGDSLTKALNSDGTDANTSKYYHTHIAEETGITVVNMGQGGTGYKKTDDVGAAFYQRIVNIPTDADVVTILGSLNDLSRTVGYTIGEITDTGTETVCGCINTTLDTLFNLFPLANVGIITPVPNDYYNYPNMATDERTHRVIEYCEKLTKICHRRSIPVLDMFHESGMRPWDANFKAALMPDGTHANEAGHKILAAKIKMFIESLL